MRRAHRFRARRRCARGAGARCRTNHGARRSRCRSTLQGAHCPNTRGGRGPRRSYGRARGPPPSHGNRGPISTFVWREPDFAVTTESVNSRWQTDASDDSPSIRFTFRRLFRNSVTNFDHRTQTSM